MTRPDHHNPSEVPDIRRIDRRRFLALLGSAGALGAVACTSTADLVMQSVPPDHRLDDGPAGDALPAAAFGDRRLVVIELQGGNDGLAMLQPVDAPGLRGIRPDLQAEPDELHTLGDGFGWHPNLSRLGELGAAAVVGVGSHEPDFSHFEMEQRWWRGESGQRSRATTGFFGRLCDQLDVGAPVTGLSLSGGPTPALLSEKAVTVGLSDPGASWFFGEDDPWLRAHGKAIAAMSTSRGSESAAMDRARSGLGDVTRFASSIADIDEGDTDRYPWTDLGRQLRFASEVMKLDAGVRVLHVRLGGFDTHTGQRWRHDALMAELDEAVGVFVDDLREQGRFESTLIATTSEFGRRAEQNDGGTDHGGASTMLVCGAGTSGVHGDAPDLSALDDGNVVATARFEDYYATLAEEWFGVPAEDVLPAGGDVIGGIVPT